MIGLQQAKNGLMRYIDVDIMPHLSGGKKLLASAYVALALENLVAELMKHKDNPYISMTNAICGEEIDIDRIYNAVAPHFTERITMSIPMFGDFTFDRSDLDKLYSYMRG